MKANATSPTATLARFAASLPSTTFRPPSSSRRRSSARLARLRARGQGRAAGRGDRAFRAADGPVRRPVRGPDLAPSHVAAVRRDGQRRRVALRRAGRRAQRLGVSIRATVVFPPALAVAQATDASGAISWPPPSPATKSASASANSSAARTTRVFHTTGTAGTLAAAAAGRASCWDSTLPPCSTPSDPPGTQAAGLWEFLRDAADSKQLHTAKAAADGLLAAYLARDGFTGARAFSKARRAWPRACRATPIRRGSPTASATAGRSRRPRSSARVVPAHASGRRCVAAPSSTSTISRRRASPRHRACAPGRDRRARVRDRARRPCTRRSSRWARCSA